MTTPIAYPDTNGFRASPVSAVVKVNGNEFVGFKEITGSRKRERGMVTGANADPIGKTRGMNKYALSMSVYLAEWKAFLLDPSNFGNGYGDVPYPVEITVTENGYDTQTWRFEGCTTDGNELKVSTSGTDALAVESIDFNPLKLYINNLDDNAQPLGGAPAIG
jgi:hypothetical protein